MSQYLNFFMKTPKGEYFPIQDYSRSTVMYSCAGAPYNKLRALTDSRYINICSRLEVARKNAQDAIDSYKQKIEFIRTTNSPLQEKIDALCDFDDDIKEEEATVEEATNALSDLRYMSEMARTLAYQEGWSKAEQIIYYGVEVEDMVEEE